ncbi:nucleoside triphosphate pyrophosphohydrolase [Actinosynnema sp. CA-248983]
MALLRVAGGYAQQCRLVASGNTHQNPRVPARSIFKQRSRNETMTDSPDFPVVKNGEKLVRDRIPELIEREGRQACVRVAQPNEYHHLLRQKLAEEVREFLDGDDPEELADILEVLLALAQDVGLSAGDLETIRAVKAAERGAFTKRLVWSPQASG